MHVYALIGPSGTGKSHHAIFVAQEYQINMIIDDGLLIQGSRILAGHSAKRSQTKIGAIKTALFSDNDHASQVINILQELNPSSLLILGTSRGMVEKIAVRLKLNPPETIINIEDIVSQRSIVKAKQIREKYGTHVIPAPTVEVKPKFSGSIINPLRSLFQRKGEENKPVISRHLWVEQTTVRPAFNYLGKFFIANDVISEIVKYIGLTIAGVEKVSRVSMETTESGLLLHADVHLIYGYFIPQVMADFQDTVKNRVEKMTSLNIISIDVHAVKLIINENPNILPD